MLPQEQPGAALASGLHVPVLPEPECRSGAFAARPLVQRQLDFIPLKFTGQVKGLPVAEQADLRLAQPDGFAVGSIDLAVEPDRRLRYRDLQVAGEVFPGALL